MTTQRKVTLTVTALGAALLLGGCGTQIEDARPAFGYSGLAAGNPAASTYEQAKVDFQAARYGLAVRRFQLAMAEDPASVEAVNGLAAAYDKIGRYDLAERFYRRALAMDPGSVQTLNNLGYSLMLQGKHDLALAFFRDAAHIEPDNPVIAANAERTVAARVQEQSRELAAASAPAEAPEPQPEPAPEATLRIVRMSPSEQRLELQPQPAVLTIPLAPPMPAVPVEAVETQPLPAPDEPVGPRVAVAAVAVPLRPAVQHPPVERPTLERLPVERPAVDRPAVYYIKAAVGPEAVVPAGPSETLAAAADLDGSVEVSNGAGRRYMAARMRIYLTGLGLDVARLTNADHFGYRSTTVTYRPGHRALAEALSASLPIAPLLQQVAEQAADVRIQLGGDLLEFDHGLLQAERNRSHAHAL